MKSELPLVGSSVRLKGGQRVKESIATGLIEETFLQGLWVPTNEHLKIKPCIFVNQPFAVCHQTKITGHKIETLEIHWKWFFAARNQWIRGIPYRGWKWKETVSCLVTEILCGETFRSITIVKDHPPVLKHVSVGQAPRKRNLKIN